MKQQLIKIAKTTGNYLVKNSPHIFTGLAVAGVVGTVALVIKGQYEADAIVNEEENDRLISASENEEEEYSPVDMKERMKLTWKCYIPAGISTVTTIGFMIASDVVNTRRLAAVSALYAASQKALDEYKSATKELTGERTSQKIRDKLAEDELAKHPVDENQIFETGGGNTLCYDPMSGRYFHSSANSIMAAKNDFNERLLTEYQLSLNEWYDYVGLDQIALGDYVGFKMGEKLQLSFSSRVASNGTPCLVVVYDTEPKLTYRDW